jgi:hypothetical protein
MDSERDLNISEPKAPEPLPVDPDQRLDWDFDIGERPAPARKWQVPVGPMTETNGAEESVVADELIIQEPKTLVRGQTRVTVVGGGRDRPIIVLDDEICPE